MENRECENQNVLNDKSCNLSDGEKCILSQKATPNEKTVLNDKSLDSKSMSDGKSLSKWAMILAAMITLTYNIFVVITTRKVPTIDEQQSILVLGSGLILFFSPVYLSIWLDKIFGGKK